jgi:hypothetical protein
VHASALALSVRAFSVWETLVIGIVVGLGVSFVTWLIAGYYERRGGFGKK